MIPSVELEKSSHPNTSVREEALKFLYKCDIEKIYYFSNLLFESHSDDFQFNRYLRQQTKNLAKGVLDNLFDLDQTIHRASNNWSLERMSSTDRTVLRLAVFEMCYTSTPKKVVVNEAIELAKKYGSQHSGRFVNGILDALMH